MKTVQKNDVIRRIEEHQVAHFLSQGYQFCTKAVWKENVRDVKVLPSNPKEKVKSKKKPKKSKKS